MYACQKSALFFSVEQDVLLYDWTWTTFKNLNRKKENTIIKTICPECNGFSAQSCLKDIQRCMVRLTFFSFFFYMCTLIPFNLPSCLSLPLTAQSWCREAQEAEAHLLLKQLYRLQKSCQQRLQKHVAISCWYFNSTLQLKM